jgi:glycosyltransferase involved in cell wall biosynthesis
MKKSKILYIHDPENESSRIFAEQLKGEFRGWEITITAPSLRTLLFESRKYDIVHLFLPFTGRASQYVRRLSGKTKLIHTVTAFPGNVEHHKNNQVAQNLIVFCEEDRKRIANPDLNISVIPPAVNLPDVNQLLHSHEIKDKFEIGDRLFAVALCDVSNKQDYDSFKYVIREFNRRGEFRFIVPRIKMDAETLKWRRELQKQIENEKLPSTTLLQEDVDLHSLLDSADFAVHLKKERDSSFDFPLSIVEASLIGRPVLCYNIPPYNDFIAGFRKSWTVNNIEELIPAARDLHHQASNLEQLSTELARYARRHLSIDRIASTYKTLYQNILESSDARAS